MTEQRQIELLRQADQNFVGWWEGETPKKIFTPEQTEEFLKKYMKKKSKKF